MGIKKDKRAEEIVLPETLKLIIAVLCILALVYLAVSLYTLFTVKSKLVQARGTLKEIMSELQGDWEGKQFKSVLINSPKDWRIISYQEEKLICICPRESNKEAQSKICNTQGICEKIDLNFEIDMYCAPGPILNCYPLRNLPIELVIEKKQDVYQLKSKEQAEAGGIFQRLLEYKGEETKNLGELFKELSEDFSDRSQQQKIRNQLNEFLKEGEGYDWQLYIVPEGGILGRPFMRSFNTEEFEFDEYIGEAQSVEVENSKGEKYKFYVYIMTIKKKGVTSEIGGSL